MSQESGVSMRLAEIWWNLWGSNSVGGQVFLVVASALLSWGINIIADVPVDRDVEVTLVFAAFFATLLLSAHSFDKSEAWPRFVLSFFGSGAYGVYVGGVFYEIFREDGGVAPSALLQIADAAMIGFAFWAAGGMSRGDRWSYFMDGQASDRMLVRVLVSLKMQREHVLANKIAVAVATHQDVFPLIKEAIPHLQLSQREQKAVWNAIRVEITSYWRPRTDGDSVPHRRRQQRKGILHA